MESTDSSMGSHQPQLPPGFRFHPTDEELVVHYLKKKASSAPLPVSIIAEVDLYKFDPWELPAKATFGEQEWYFFSPRDRKYPNGARPNRAATSGYWKATGTDKPVLTSGGTQKVGVKKALVFYGGKPPKGIKTNWIMHEYRLTDNKPSNKPPGCDNKKNSLRLDDWVLCRIYQKHNAHRPVDHDKDDPMDDHHRHHHHHMIGSIPPSMTVGHASKLHFQNPKSGNYGALLENEHNMFDGMLGNDNMLQHHQTGAGLSLKRTAPLQPLYWSDADPSSAATTSGKKYHADGTAAEEGNSSAIATLLGQLPQTPSQLHQQTMLGSLGDGVFRPQFQLPGMNWYS